MENTAHNIIHKCGGFSTVAEWLGVRVQTVYRWTYPKDRGGTSGVVPHAHQKPLMVAARARGINLNPEDFFGLPHLGDLDTSGSAGSDQRLAPGSASSSVRVVVHGEGIRSSSVR